MPDVTNKQIADALADVADLMEILGESGFRVNSYRKGARVIEDVAQPAAALAAEGKLTDLPGVGKGLAERIEQFVRTGTMDLLEELKAKLPPKLPELLNVPGLGPKTVARLWRQGNIVDLASLADAIEENTILEVEGIGAKKAQQIWQALKFAAASAERTLLGEADAIAGELVEAVRGYEGVERVEVAGSLRRGRETVGDIDLLCQADAAKGEAIVKAFAEGRGHDLPIESISAAGATKGSVRIGRGVQVDLRVVPVESFGAAWQYFTGSKEHNVRLRNLASKRGWKLNEYGLFDGETQLAGADEEGMYAKLGLAWVPPELREDRGEIGAAGRGALPELLTLADIRGDLHMHTTASDGRESIETMIAACRERGYAFMAVADHSKGQVQANGLDEKRLAEHAEAIRAAGASAGIKVYVSCEVDVFKDGSLDFDDDTLARLDFAIGSPHSALSMKGPDATRRIIKAIENPFIRAIGHPTGRLVNARPGMEVDIGEIAAAAAEHDTALEINASPHRLDLRDTHVRAAIVAGAKIIINTDAHTIAELDNMRFGVSTARRGWATVAEVVNAMSADRFDQWVRRG